MCKRLIIFTLLCMLSPAGLFAQNTSTDGTLRRINVPILMYHYISELPPDADEYRVNLTVSPQQFRAHMEYLATNGYTPITLDALDEALRTGTALPARPVVLTFDDGHRDHYTNAFPILQEFGFTGTFFVITGLLDINHPDYLSWEQAQTMEAAGMRVEPHTKTHRQLNDRDRDFLVYEILGSIESVEAHINRRPSMFAYPAGRYDPTTLTIMEEMGIQRALTTQYGYLHTTSNHLEVQRIRISNDTTVDGLHYILTNAS